MTCSNGVGETGDEVAPVGMDSCIAVRAARAMGL